MRYILLLIIVFLPCSIFSEDLEWGEFYEQPLKEILQAIADAAHITIVIDETIEGNVSFTWDSLGLEDLLKVLCTTYTICQKYGVNMIRLLIQS